MQKPHQFAAQDSDYSIGLSTISPFTLRKIVQKFDRTLGNFGEQVLGAYSEKQLGYELRQRRSARLRKALPVCNAALFTHSIHLDKVGYPDKSLHKWKMANRSPKVAWRLLIPGDNSPSTSNVRIGLRDFAGVTRSSVDSRKDRRTGDAVADRKSQESIVPGKRTQPDKNPPNLLVKQAVIPWGGGTSRPICAGSGNKAIFS